MTNLKFNRNGLCMKKITFVLLFILLPINAGATNVYFKHGYGIINRALAGASVVKDHITIGATIKTKNVGEISLEVMHALHNSFKGVLT